MLENQNEIDISAPPESVWQILTNLDNYVEWNPLLHHASGRIETGEMVIVHARTATKDMRLKCKVTMVEPLSEFVWCFSVIHPLLFRGEHIFRIEPFQDGVRFTDRERFSGLLLPTQAQDLKINGLAAMIDMGKSLKTRAEQI